MKFRMLILAAMAAAALPAMAADRIQIVNQGAIDARWTIVPGTQLMPPYPDAYAKDAEEVCMVVGYLVNADGTTSDFSLLKSWASGGDSRSRAKFWADFADLSSRALAQWRYTPKDPASAKPVYTATTFVFGNQTNALATQEHCAVPDVAQRLVELRYDSRAGRMMARGIYGQLDIDPKLEERYRLHSVADRERINEERTARSIQNERSAPTPPPPSGGKK
jgi:hypothetical protein